MNRRQYRTALVLTNKASDKAIAYYPVYYPAEGRNLPVVKSGGFTWYPVDAVAADGRRWLYYLAADYGSYRGAYPAEIGA